LARGRAQTNDDKKSNTHKSINPLPPIGGLTNRHLSVRLVDRNGVAANEMCVIGEELFLKKIEKSGPRPLSNHIYGRFIIIIIIITLIVQL